MELIITAPNRIDLAGGTTDLYPLYIFMGGGYTVNAAISVSSKVILKKRDNAGFRIVSEDLGYCTHADSLSELSANGPLALVSKAVRTFPPPYSLEICTRNEAPPGSGLGASSSLLVALLSGLLNLNASQESTEGIVSLAVNTETAVIGVPAGSQDHIAALYGGISCIRFDHKGFQREPMQNEQELAGKLEEMIVLSYTGLGRFSGMNNWEVTKNYIDNVGQTREKLLAIRDIAVELGNALSERDLDAVAPLVQKEWNVRRTLAPGISTPEIEELMKAALSAGAQANKICGAGGGGCMVTLCPPDKKTAVQNAIASAGGKIMPFHIDTIGTSITSTL